MTSKIANENIVSCIQVIYIFGWATGRASSLQNIQLQQSTNFLSVRTAWSTRPQVRRSWGLRGL